MRAGSPIRRSGPRCSPAAARSPRQLRGHHAGRSPRPRASDARPGRVDPGALLHRWSPGRPWVRRDIEAMSQRFLRAASPRLLHVRPGPVPVHRAGHGRVGGVERGQHRPRPVRVDRGAAEGGVARELRPGWLAEGEPRGQRPADRDCVAPHHRHHREYGTDDLQEPGTQGQTHDGEELRQLVRFPNVILQLSGHTHQNKVWAHHNTGLGTGYWEVTPPRSRTTRPRAGPSSLRTTATGPCRSSR